MTLDIWQLKPKTKKLLDVIGMLIKRHKHSARILDCGIAVRLKFKIHTESLLSEP